MHRSGRRRAGQTMLLVGLVALMVMPAAPATALHQYCGKDATGVHLGGYPGETKDNGHPDGEGDYAKYAGRGAIGPLTQTALALNLAESGLGLAATGATSETFNAVSKATELVIHIAEGAMGVVTTAMDAALLAVQQRAAEVNACNDVLAGDTIDLIFTTLLQEELANLDPADGTVTVPTSLFLLPDDNSPHWTSHDAGTGDLADDQDLSIPYVDGFADTSDVGVAHVVRNTIAHLQLHGVCTTGGRRWDPEEGFVDVDSAADLWWDAMHYLEDGRVREAHQTFAEAYQSAVGAPMEEEGETPPELAGTSDVTLEDPPAQGDVVETFTASDADGDDLVVNIVDDDMTMNRQWFEVELDDSGQDAYQLVVVSPPEPHEYTVKIVASDGCGPTAQETVVITVVNHAPIINDTTFMVSGGAGNGATVGTLTASDPDGDTLEYTLENPDNFALDKVTGELTIASDDLTAGTYTLTVTVNDGHGRENSTAQATVTVMVEDSQGTESPAPTSSGSPT